MQWCSQFHNLVRAFINLTDGCGYQGQVRSGEDYKVHCVCYLLISIRAAPFASTTRETARHRFRSPLPLLRTRVAQELRDEK
jgi:hypothetical protein